MSELRRWLEDAPPSEVRRLLEAGQWARPAGSVLEQTLLRVRAGIPADVSDLAVPTERSGALRAGIKWTLAGALLLGSIGALTYGMQSDEPSSRNIDTVGQARTTPTVSPAPGAQAKAARPASSPPAEALVPPEAASPAPQKPRGVAAPAAAPARASESARTAEGASRAKVCKPGVVEQISMLEQAKSLIQRGRGTDALAILDRYDAFGAGRCFVPESLKHRMDAYAQAGNPSGAARTATAIKTHYPDTAQARAADAVLKHK
ncbi:MAG TPA: hypothetical protein VFU02_18530 [Polyangiaceae bacterium]|nr:hypothetical protein [Polyangiaceae bacterium]